MLIFSLRPGSRREVLRLWKLRNIRKRWLNAEPGKFLYFLPLIFSGITLILNATQRSFNNPVKHLRSTNITNATSKHYPNLPTSISCTITYFSVQFVSSFPILLKKGLKSSSCVLRNLSGSSTIQEINFQVQFQRKNQ